MKIIWSVVMNGHKTKELRKQFVAWFGSMNSEGSAYKYNWRLTKKSRVDKRAAQIPAKKRDCNGDIMRDKNGKAIIVKTWRV
jgi:hypothetical protein